MGTPAAEPDAQDGWQRQHTLWIVYNKEKNRFYLATVLILLTVAPNSKLYSGGLLLNRIKKTNSLISLYRKFERNGNVWYFIKYIPYIRLTQTKITTYVIARLWVKSRQDAFFTEYKRTICCLPESFVAQALCFWSTTVAIFSITLVSPIALISPHCCSNSKLYSGLWCHCGNMKCHRSWPGFARVHSIILSIGASDAASWFFYLFFRKKERKKACWTPRRPISGSTAKKYEQRPTVLFLIKQTG